MGARHCAPCAKRCPVERPWSATKNDGERRWPHPAPEYLRLQVLCTAERRLENRQRGDSFVGSNPTPSASFAGKKRLTRPPLPRLRAPIRAPLCARNSAEQGRQGSTKKADNSGETAGMTRPRTVDKAAGSTARRYSPRCPWTPALLAGRRNARRVRPLGTQRRLELGETGSCSRLPDRPISRSCTGRREPQLRRLYV